MVCLAGIRKTGVGIRLTFLLTCLLTTDGTYAQSQQTREYADDECSAADRRDDQFLSLKDIFQLEYASDPQISPDGSTIVFVRNRFDIMKDRRVSELWQLKNGSLRPLLSGGISIPKTCL
jgi:hypothetical protein